MEKGGLAPFIDERNGHPREIEEHVQRRTDTNRRAKLSGPLLSYSMEGRACLPTDPCQLENPLMLPPFEGAGVF